MLPDLTLVSFSLQNTFKLSTTPNIHRAQQEKTSDSHSPLAAQLSLPLSCDYYSPVATSPQDMGIQEYLLAPSFSTTMNDFILDCQTPVVASPMGNQ